MTSAACAAPGEGFDSAEQDSGATTHPVWPTTKPDAGHPTGDASTLEDGSITLPDGAVVSGGPTPDECLDDWAEYDGGCAAPTITDSYVGNGCEGTTGWFVDGTNFQLRQHNVGVADYGPQSFGANGNQMNWNEITPTQLCVTVAASSTDTTWTGHTIYVVNPDGKMSNSVVVTNKL
jgi:hypothetical protein